MPAVPLPENPSLEHLKNQAKLVQSLVREGDEGALAMVTEFHPRLGGEDPGASSITGFKRSDAQLVVARLYGFQSWNELRRNLAIVEALNRPDTDDASFSDEGDRFVAAACLAYGSGYPIDRIGRAHTMLGRRPELAHSSEAAMAVVGDHGALKTRLDAEPALLTVDCGPNRWPLLLYCAYSRIETDEDRWSTLETARLLVARGADPNAGFLWRGLVPPFTALTGAFGRGEQDQPRHGEFAALARLLLEAGADPNDDQTLYNNGLGGTPHDDPTHLRLLVEFGLGTDQGGPWYQRLGSRLTPPEELLYNELEVAAARNLPNRLRFLVDLGLDLGRPVGRSRLTPVRIAAQAGNTEILALLGDAGQDVSLLPVEQLVHVARTGSPDDLRAFATGQPNAVDKARSTHPSLIKDVAWQAGPGVVRALVDVGFDVNARTGGSGTTALHGAARRGDVDLARALVELGADPNLVDDHVGATPLDWARHFHQAETVTFLEPLTDGSDDTEALRDA